MKLKIYLLQLSFNEENRRKILENIAAEVQRILRANGIVSELIIAKRRLVHPKNCERSVKNRYLFPGGHALDAECARRFIDSINFNGQKVAITSWYLWLKGDEIVKGISFPGRTAVVVSWKRAKEHWDEAGTSIESAKSCARAVVHELIHNLGVVKHHHNCIMINQGELRFLKYTGSNIETICKKCRAKIKI